MVVCLVLLFATRIIAPAKRVKTVISPGTTDKGRPNPNSIGESEVPDLFFPSIVVG